MFRKYSLLSRIHRADQGCGQDQAKRRIGAGNESKGVVVEG